MKLAIFDIDGTLTETHGRYDEYYAQAVEETLNVASISRNWREYPSSTDSGIMHDVCIRRLGRPPTPCEIQEAQTCYMRKLENVYQGAQQVPGASQAIVQLTARSDWGVALATGNWAVAASFKLSRAGLLCDELPRATADDALKREDIIKIAIENAHRFYNIFVFQKIVYVGDAAWDVDAAFCLGLAFVLRAPRSEQSNVQYRTSHALADFTNFDVLLDALKSATIPLIDNKVGERTTRYPRA